MALPTPAPGLVIRYGYLWRREHLAGLEGGQKDRPCAIVAAVKRDVSGATRVLVLPITHRAPESADDAMEIPATVKLRLGLDGARSWIVLSEWNDFTWPGPELRPVPGPGETSFAYGMLPPTLFTAIRERLLTLALRRKQGGVRRSE